MKGTQANYEIILFIIITLSDQTAKVLMEKTAPPATMFFCIFTLFLRRMFNVVRHATS